MGDAAQDTDRLEESLATRDQRHFHLRLFVVGATPSSQRAIVTLAEMCRTELEGRHELEVIDVYQHPDRAVAEQIVATPTLIRIEPLPSVRLVGDLSDRRRVMLGLDLVLAGDPGPS